MIPRIIALPLPAVPCIACGACGLFADTCEVFAQPGDLAMCVRCEAVQILTDAMTVRPVEAADVDTFDPDDLARFYAVIHEMRSAMLRRN